MRPNRRCLITLSVDFWDNLSHLAPAADIADSVGRLKSFCQCQIWYDLDRGIKGFQPYYPTYQDNHPLRFTQQPTVSDSLKDQLLKAGFKEQAPTGGNSSGKSSRPPRKSGARKSGAKGSKSAAATNGKNGQQHSQKNPRSSNNKHRASSSHSTGKTGKSASTQTDSVDPKVAAEKKRVKAAIKELIESNTLKKFTGEIAYSYVLGNRVRQIFVSKEVVEKLAAQEYVITRLNGSTHLIKPELAEQILALNPDWAIVRNNATDSKENTSSDGYENYEIPDDLMW